MYEWLVLLSEVVLSAYPILIKKVDASVFLQTGIRMWTFVVCAAIAALITGAPLAGFGFTETTVTGLLNLLHVGSSYTAFEALPAGNAMSLFYTYPIWNLIGAAFAFKETIPQTSIPWIAIAAIGAILLSQPTKQNWTLLGVIAALVAALTETGIYLWFRKSDDKGEPDTQPWTKMLSMYGGSGILWIGLALVLMYKWRTWLPTSAGGLKTMLLFNTLIGFVGYGLRFYMIPKVSTIAFSAMSFFGIVAAYLLGWIFVGEVPNIMQAIGAGLIILANSVLLTKENA